MPDDNGYLISSLYFDDMYHSAMDDKISGVQFRKKFRIRSYNYDDHLIHLECKYKYGEYISKLQAPLTREEYDSLLSGNYNFLLNRNEQVCRELFCYNRTKMMKPSVVVEYQREAYTSSLGNVRITFDKDLSASSGTLDIFASDYTTTKILPNDIMILEVKYDDYLPEYIKSILQTSMTDRCAISKYVMCRVEKGRKKFR